MKKNKKKHQNPGAVRLLSPANPSAPIGISIDFRYVPAPETYLFADSVSIKNDKESGTTYILFGFFTPKKGSRQDCINIVMPSLSLYGQFLQSALQLEETLDNALKQVNLSIVQRPVPDTAEIGSTVFANVASVFIGSLDCSIDFYYMPIKDVHLAKQFGTSIDLAPVLRVLLPAGVLKYFLELCRPFRVQAPATGTTGS
jgi:hypothetical protein